MYRFSLAIALLLALAAPSWADQIVIEHYDCVLLVNQADSESIRLVFFRDGQIMATRFAHDEMLWGVSGSDFVLIWDDWGGPRRAIYFTTLATLVVKGDDPYADGGGEWHCMQRNMRNLKDAP